jgi:hypothetical protein
MKPLMDLIAGQFPCLSYLWPDTGHNGKGNGRDWIEKTLRWTVEVVRPQDLPSRRPGVKSLRRGRVSQFCRAGGKGCERSVIDDQNRSISKDYEKLAASIKAFILVARRLARS